MPFVISHITDSHLSDGKPFFNSNFNIIHSMTLRDPPDLLINTGDVSLNGADHVADLIHARSLHEALGVDWVAIPGNHDIGDNQEIARKQPTNNERRQRWLDVFGADRFLRDVPGWRLLGINSLLLGSDIEPAASEQEAFVADAAASLGDRRLALFLHKPLFHDTPEDREVSGHAVNPDPRARLFAALGDVTPALVCCGHLHEYRERAHGPLHQVWAPATSFTLSDWFLQTHGGVHIVGFVRLTLHEDGRFETLLQRPEGLVTHDLADFPEAYGDLRAIKAAIDAQKAAAE